MKCYLDFRAKKLLFLDVVDTFNYNTSFYLNLRPMSFHLVSLTLLIDFPTLCSPPLLFLQIYQLISPSLSLSLYLSLFSYLFISPYILIFSIYYYPSTLINLLRPIYLSFLLVPFFCFSRWSSSLCRAFRVAAFLHSFTFAKVTTVEFRSMEIGK